MKDNALVPDNPADLRDFLNEASDNVHKVADLLEDAADLVDNVIDS